MWCRIQSAAIMPLILTGWLNIQSTEAFGISSFGKANTDPPKPATPPPAPGSEQVKVAAADRKPCVPNMQFSTRPCSKQTECAGISGTSCVRTRDDGVTRCLCGDNVPPLNGQCEAQFKTLYHVCSNSDECNEGMVCGAPNVTGAAPAHLRVHAPQDRICLCDVETGYREKEHTCSDADILKTSMFAVIVVACMRKLLAY